MVAEISDIGLNYERLVQTANLVRERLDEHESSSAGCCLEASMSLCIELASKRLEPKLLEGYVFVDGYSYNHYWVFCLGFYIDITADQFNCYVKNKEYFPKVLIDSPKALKYHITKNSVQRERWKKLAAFLDLNRELYGSNC